MIKLMNLLKEMMSPYGKATNMDKRRGYIGSEYHGVIYAYDEIVPDVLHVDHSDLGQAAWGHRWRFFIEYPKNTLMWNGDTFPPEKEVEIRVIDWLEGKKKMKVEKQISPKEYYHITGKWSNG